MRLGRNESKGAGRILSWIFDKKGFINTSPQYLHMAAMAKAGKIPGVKMMRKFGRVTNAQTADTPFDISEMKNLYTWLDSNTEMTLSSANAADAAAGTGMRTAHVDYYDEDYAEHSVEMPLNGVNGVTLKSDMILPFRAYGLTYGSGGTNAGAVYIGSGDITAGVPDNVHGLIKAGDGQTQQAFHAIPAGYNGFVTYARTGLIRAKNGYADIELVKQEYGSGGFRDQESFPLDNNAISFIGESFDVPIQVGEKGRISMRAADIEANDTSIMAGFHVWMFSTEILNELGMDVM